VKGEGRGHPKTTGPEFIHSFSLFHHMADETDMTLPALPSAVAVLDRGYKDMIHILRGDTTQLTPERRRDRDAVLALAGPPLLEKGLAVLKALVEECDSLRTKLVLAGHLGKAITLHALDLDQKVTELSSRLPQVASMIKPMGAKLKKKKKKTTTKKRMTREKK
jgi:hypothetical protein